MKNKRERPNGVDKTVTSKKLLRAVIEAMEILAVKEEIKDIVSGIRDINEGRVYTEKEFLEMISRLDGK